MNRSVQLGELGAFEEDTVDRTIMHKNMEPVVFVTAEMAEGRERTYAVLSQQAELAETPLPDGIRAVWTRRRRMENHRRCLPRSRHRLLRRALLARHLRPRRLRNRLPPAAHRHHALHPPHPHRHHARLLAPQRRHGQNRRRLPRPCLLHRHGHDRHDRARRHRPAQRHPHPHRLHPQHLPNAASPSRRPSSRPAPSACAPSSSPPAPRCSAPDHHLRSHLRRPGLVAIFGLFISTAFTLVVVPVAYGLLYNKQTQPEG